MKRLINLSTNKAKLLLDEDNRSKTENSEQLARVVIPEVLPERQNIYYAMPSSARYSGEG